MGKIILKDVEVSSVHQYRRAVSNGRLGKIKVTLTVNNDQLNTKDKIYSTLKDLFAMKGLDSDAAGFCLKAPPHNDFRDCPLSQWELTTMSNTALLGCESCSRRETLKDFPIGSRVDAIVDFWVQEGCTGVNVKSTLHSLQKATL